MLTFLWGHCTAATAALRNYLVMAILRRWRCIGLECSIVITRRFWTWDTTSLRWHPRIYYWSEAFGLFECTVACRCCLHSGVSLLVAYCVHHVYRWRVRWSCLGSCERRSAILIRRSIHGVSGGKSARIRPNICATNFHGLRSILWWWRSLLLISEGLVMA